MIQEYASDLLLLVNNTVGLFLVIRFLNHLLDKRDIEKIRRRWEKILILIVSVTINILVENLGVSLLWGIIIFFLVGDLFYQGKKHVKLVVAIFIVVFSFAVELTTAVLSGLLFETSILDVRNNVMHLFLGGIISKLLLMLLVEVIIRFRRSNASKISLGSWLLIISIPIISIVLAVISVYEPMINNSASNMSILSCISIIYINLIAFYLFDNIITQIDENHQIRLREEQLLLQQYQYKNIISGHNKVKMIRHDMLGHLIAIDGYLTNNKIEEAKSYIKKLHNELDFSRQGILSENVAVDAIINNRKTIAKELGIEMNHDIMIPQNMKINDMDICVVLGNALNNSIEACQRIGEDIQKYINLKMRYKKEVLLIDVRNPYNIDTIKVRNGHFVSSKPFRRKEEIGTGIGNIKAVAEKYNGLCETEMLSDVFVLKVMIPDKIIGINL
ncbi:GHKL domain-containing protein [Defluviitalea saccharophila]|uniref:GHKL domain-containing protein n=1 Tax=Defluviitalea saccharophila TaxID=879970 RepID=A0ABZ2Y3A1_9FIRM